MGRKAKLDPEQVKQIQTEYAEGAKVKILALYYGVSAILIYRVINSKGAYRVDPAVLGQPILDCNGRIINVIPTSTEG